MNRITGALEQMTRGTTLEDEDENDLNLNKTADSACKNGDSSTQIRINADLLLIGTSIIKDIDTERMSHGMVIRKHVLQQKTIEGALKFNSHLDGNITTLLLQIGSNDLEHGSPLSVYEGIEKAIKLINTKFPGSKVLVSGLLSRWKINPREGMVFKNKTSEVNEKLSQLPGLTFCAQDNFHRHMFYDGTHLNPQGTTLLVSNYKYRIGKTRADGNSMQRENNSPLNQHNRPNFTRKEKQRHSYASRVHGHMPNASKSTIVGKQTGSGSGDKLYLLVKLLKEIMNSD